MVMIEEMVSVVMKEMVSVVMREMTPLVMKRDIMTRKMGAAKASHVVSAGGLGRE